MYERAQCNKDQLFLLGDPHLTTEKDCKSWTVCVFFWNGGNDLFEGIWEIMPLHWQRYLLGCPTFTQLHCWVVVAQMCAQVWSVSTLTQVKQCLTVFCQLFLFPHCYIQHQNQNVRMTEDDVFSNCCLATTFAMLSAVFAVILSYSSIITLFAY